MFTILKRTASIQMMAEWISLPLQTMQTNLSPTQFQIFFTTH